MYKFTKQHDLMEELPVQETKRGWGRVVLWVLLTPLLLFVLLMALLYVPPVQNIIRQKATEIASEATGMNISVQRIDLRFPLNLLVRGVKVVQEPDTLLDLQRLSVRVQAWPLLKGQVEVDEVLVEDAVVNSANFIEGMHVQGNLGRFFLESHGIDLSGEEIVLNEIELNDTKVAVLMNDTITAPPDSASAPLNWKINLHSLALNNVDVALNMPLDSMRLSARLGSAKVLNAKADLLKQHYACQQFVVDKTALTYDVGNATPVSGFDPSHIALRDITIGVDSLLFAGENLGAIIRKFSLNERSGLSLVSVDGR
ncbi:MAG: translocation/assembly module TamB, partial [Bacteroides sp.]|nr:translocation/assembly module TamB [Bacteroides sp.]